MTWYETNGTFYPEYAGESAVWRMKYALFDNATGLPVLRQNVTVAEQVHVGNLTPIHAGDFSYIVLRRGDPLGRVAMAFACDGNNSIGCPASPPVPVFAIQTTGMGLYG